MKYGVVILQNLFEKYNLRMKKIATILTVYNRKEKTLKCLENVFKASLPEDTKIDIFLTNDGCTDGTVDAVKQKFANVNIINGDGTLFWNRGMYAAWEEASKYDYDYFLWLNDDTSIFKEAIENAIETSVKKNDSVILIGATSEEDCITTSYSGWLGNKMLPINNKLQECDYFNGNFVLVPNKVFKVLGNLDYKYRHSHGDFDYGYKAKKAGIKAFVLPSFIGTCKRDFVVLNCFNAKYPVKKRLKMFYSPLGKNPFEFFYFNRKNKGILVATRIFITNHIRVFLPYFFNK